MASKSTVEQDKKWTVEQDKFLRDIDRLPSGYDVTGLFPRQIKERFVVVTSGTHVEHFR